MLVDFYFILVSICDGAPLLAIFIVSTDIYVSHYLSFISLAMNLWILNAILFL